MKTKPPFRVGEIVQLRDEYRLDWRPEICALADVQFRVDRCARGLCESGYLMQATRGDTLEELLALDSGFFERAPAKDST